MLPQVLSFVLDGGSLAIPPELHGLLELAVEEAFANICSYAYPGTVNNVVVKVDDNAGGSSGITIVLRDYGVPFNPLSSPPPDLELDPLERDLGGLGIIYYKTIMDSVDYEYSNGTNILTMKKHF